MARMTFVITSSNLVGLLLISIEAGDRYVLCSLEQSSHTSEHVLLCVCVVYKSSRKNFFSL